MGAVVGHEGGGDRDRRVDVSDPQEDESAAEARESARVIRRNTARAILAAAEERDAVARARDEMAAQRENDLDRAELLDPTSDYGSHWKERRHAGMDRTYAEQDRVASREDLLRLMQLDSDSDADADADSDRDDATGTT